MFAISLHFCHPVCSCLHKRLFCSNQMYAPTYKTYYGCNVRRFASNEALLKCISHHEYFIVPVPPNFVTEYQAKFTPSEKLATRIMQRATRDVATETDPIAVATAVRIPRKKRTPKQKPPDVSEVKKESLLRCPLRSKKQGAQNSGQETLVPKKPDVENKMEQSNQCVEEQPKVRFEAATT